MLDVTPTSPAAHPPVRLVRSPAPVTAVPAPALSSEQQRVVGHDRGPLLVLAGPGTGKTTTLVEAVVARIEAGTDPERILVLTFGRKAAAELRERITARLGRTVREPLARTFHSYAFGVLRRDAAERGDQPPRLLSGAEQDLVVRELLRGELEGVGPASGWPDALRPALLTRGFAQQLRDLLLRCAERGVDAATLDRLGRRSGRDDWRAASRFLRQYAAVSALADDAAYDPAELVRAVVERWSDPRTGLLAREQGAYDWVFVDEYQDTDPGQELLLRLLVPQGGNLVAVGDPLQSIYAFRGADVRCIRRFPETFRTQAGAPAPVERLTLCRRSAPAVVHAGTSVAARMRREGRGRALQPLPGRAPGRVDVLLATSASQEAALVAGALRRAHLVDEVPWSRMAVLVRSTAGRLSVLRRAMLAAGVPVGVDAGDLPVAEQPGVRPLLDVLRVALRAESWDEDTAVALLSGPLGGMDPLALRRLRRELLREERAGAGTRPAGQLLVDALREPGRLATLSAPVARPARRVAELVATATVAAARPGANAETVLWEVWRGSGLGGRWQEASLAGGARGAAADRDLDAVMALFDAAGRFVDRLPSAGPDVFLEHVAGQQVPSDTLAAQGAEGDVVRVLTAHAAKGLEWDLVVLAGVQEGVWPDLRVRGSLLASEALVALVEDGVATQPGAAPLPALGSPLAELLEEERRLLYVAVTRARERLLVTAVQDAEEGQAPSRFLRELPLALDDEAVVVAAPVPGPKQDGVLPGDVVGSLGELRRELPLPLLLARLRDIAAQEHQPVATRRRAVELRRDLGALTRSLDLASLVGELREALVSPGADAATRDAAAHQLARLAEAGVPGADPREWYAAVPLSDDRALREAGEVVRVSPSKVEAFATCELRWLLEACGGTSPEGTAQGIGSLVHALAAAAAEDPALTDTAALLAELDRRWEEVDLGAPWFTRQQHERVRGVARRLARWLSARAGDPDRALVGAELPFRVELPAGNLVARLAGRVDRLERDREGRGYVVDVKTGGSKPSPSELLHHPQLGAYQLAVEAGAFAEHGVEGAAGAALVQVGKAARKDDALEQPQEPLQAGDDPGWARRLVVETAVGMAGSAFTARENDHCDRCPVRSSCPVRDEGRAVVAP